MPIDDVIPSEWKENFRNMERDEWDDMDRTTSEDSDSQEGTQTGDSHQEIPNNRSRRQDRTRISGYNNTSGRHTTGVSITTSSPVQSNQRQTNPQPRWTYGNTGNQHRPPGILRNSNMEASNQFQGGQTRLTTPDEEDSMSPRDGFRHHSPNIPITVNITAPDPQHQPGTGRPQHRVTRLPPIHRDSHHQSDRRERTGRQQRSYRRESPSRRGGNSSTSSNMLSFLRRD